jgi:hypothetical protein
MKMIKIITYSKPKSDTFYKINMTFTLYRKDSL